MSDPIPAADAALMAAYVSLLYPAPAGEPHGNG